MPALRRAPDLSPTIEDDRILIDAGLIAPLHRRCSEQASQHCSHLRADLNVVVRPFSTRWTIMPLMIKATLPSPAGHALMRAPNGPATIPVITFLQLCGVAEDRDPGWKSHPARYRPVSRAA